MSEMVERVARAIWASTEPHSPWDDLPERWKETNLAEARAAIEAMRKPTTGIVIEIAASLVCADEMTAGMVWDAVIDEALK